MHSIGKPDKFSLAGLYTENTSASGFSLCLVIEQERSIASQQPVKALICAGTVPVDVNKLRSSKRRMRHLYSRQLLRARSDNTSACRNNISGRWNATAGAS